MLNCQKATRHVKVLQGCCAGAAQSMYIEWSERPLETAGEWELSIPWHKTKVLWNKTFAGGESNKRLGLLFLVFCLYADLSQQLDPTRIHPQRYNTRTHRGRLYFFFIFVSPSLLLRSRSPFYTAGNSSGFVARVSRLVSLSLLFWRSFFVIRYLCTTRSQRQCPMPGLEQVISLECLRRNFRNIL